MRVRAAVAQVLLAATSAAAPAAALPASPRAVAPPRAHGRPTADSARVARPSKPEGTEPVRTPSAPPLTSGAGEADPSATGAGLPAADPLVANGLASPLCRGGGEPPVLPTQAKHNCATSGFVAAAAPTASYGFDVHIDTGVLGLGDGALMDAVQDLVLTPLWMAIVWLVHALVVMLEWAFTIDLLGDGSTVVGSTLRRIEGALTEPWLALVLAVAAVIAAYDGLVRRRVAETLAEAGLVLVMMAGGLWVIADPSGTVGVLSDWANTASLGTFATASSGTPLRANATLASSMDSVFATVVGVPWCYLEFGDVAWCGDPSRMEPRVRTAARTLARRQQALIGCEHRSSLLDPCAPDGSDGAAALARSARLLREAGTNGAAFLALPANSSARNSINDSGSLLRTICASSTATSCAGPAASEAEFRTSSATWSRAGGLLLIAVGALGLMLLLGFIGLHLLASASMALVYLLAAPAIVLAPALGEKGRAAFRGWATRLLGAVVSKLLYSLALGVAIAVTAIVSSAPSLGWWTQWLSISAFWWGMFLRRHQLLGLVSGEHHHRHRHSIAASAARHWGLDAAMRRREERRERERQAREAAPSTGARGGPSVATGTERITGGRGGGAEDSHAERLLTAERRDFNHRGLSPRLRARVEERSVAARLDRIRAAQVQAVAGGDRRRALRLGTRAQRVEAEQPAALGGSDVGSRARAAFGDGVSRTQRLAEHARFLEEQTRLPGMLGAARARREGQSFPAGRDYPALAGLLGSSAVAYAALSRRDQRAARLAIDRELAGRRRSPEAASASAGQPTQEEIAVIPRRHPASLAGDTGRGVGARGPGVGGDEPVNPVWEDILAVKEGRKRQLGFGND